MTSDAPEQPARKESPRSRLRAAASRESSDILLSVLRDGRWRPAAWGRFIQLATLRSVDTARANPRSFVQSTVIHLPFLLLADRGRRLWVLTSWLMAVTHLGMLDGRDSLGVPNTLTLVRANLPALESRLGRTLPILSLATDFADGKIARATGRVTPFGAQADFIADTAFWTWFVVRYEPSRMLLVATVAAWAAPVLGLAAAGAVKGRMTDLPRSAWFRPAAVLEIVIGVRAIIRMIRPRAASKG